MHVITKGKVGEGEERMWGLWGSWFCRHRGIGAVPAEIGAIEKIKTDAKQGVKILLIE